MQVPSQGDWLSSRTYELIPHRTARRHTFVCSRLLGPAGRGPHGGKNLRLDAGNVQGSR